MNNRQAGAHREQIMKEQRARDIWIQNNRDMLEERGQLADYLGEEEGYSDRPGSARPGSARPESARPDTRSGRPSSGRPESRGGLYDPAVYEKALRISSPRMADDPDEDVPRTVKRKVIRQVEVPFQRHVKVPVKTTKIVPTKVQKKVRTKKLVEVPSFKMVDETYTELIEEPAVRNKEVWVKKIVPERYMRKVPVTKTRKVKVPTTEIREVDDFEIVEVSGSKAIEVDGFRVDEVEDSKMVEVEEYQTYELRPFAKGPARIHGTRDVGAVRGRHHSRRVGNEVYHVQDERHRDIDLDSQVGDMRPPSRGGRMMMTRPVSAPMRPESRGGMRPGSAAMRGGAHAVRPKAGGRIGMKLKESGDNAVIVYKVNHGEAAERAGVLPNDLITYVNNRPTRNLDEFRQVLNNADGPLSVQVRRNGGRKLLLTIIR